MVINRLSFNFVTVDAFTESLTHILSILLIHWLAHP